MAVDYIPESVRVLSLIDTCMDADWFFLDRSKFVCEQRVTLTTWHVPHKLPSSHIPTSSWGAGKFLPHSYTSTFYGTRISSPKAHSSSVMASDLPQQATTLRVAVDVDEGEDLPHHILHSP